MNQINPDFSSVLRSLPSGSPKQMLSVQRDGNQTHVRINSSSLSLIQTCARKSFYLLHQGLKAKSGSPPLIFGSAIHKALEVFYNQPRGDRDIPPDFTDHASLLAHGHEAPTKHFLYDAVNAFIKEAEPLRMLPDTDKRSLSSGIWVLGHYFRTYINDVYEIYSDEQGPVTERTFSVPLIEESGLKIELFGTIDLVLRNSVTGEALVCDHKTTSMLGQEFFNRLRPNHQYTGYIFGGRHCLGLDTNNFLVNAIEVKARPLTARGGPPKFTRQITIRDEQDIAEFKDTVLWAVKSYLTWQGQNVWPLGEVNACAMYGGCSFLDVCSAPSSLRNNILESKYGHT